MSASIPPQLQTMIDNMPEKTGKKLDEWLQILGKAGLEKHGEMMSLLKGEYSVTHGFANAIVTLYRQQAEDKPASNDDLIMAQFSGKKAELKPIYDRIISNIGSFGSDLEIAPKKTYISLRRNKQFAIIKAATQTRVNLGINLKDQEPTDRLLGGNPFSGMVSHKVEIFNVDDVDQEVLAWLKKAYQAA